MFGFLKRLGELILEAERELSRSDKLYGGLRGWLFGSCILAAALPVLFQPGRTRRRKAMSTKFTLRLSSSLRRRLEEEAAHREESLSELVRRKLDPYGEVGT